ncbi:bark storage protein A-like [Mercurialis annua]|uniref:bark storage protein A-like n=1 Tax=Mercurialis annua TaxID=3986 RepID=UPI00215F13A0|nr:bark storage protein A-like [Mercurialis annua]
MAMKMVVVVLGMVAAMVQHSVQHDDHLTIPGSGCVRKIYGQILPFGIVVTSEFAEQALNESGVFTPTTFVDLHGRKFIRGIIYQTTVVYVRTLSTPSINVGLTAQILADNFNLSGIIYYGSAGATNESLSIGDVHIPGQLAFTGNWDWLSMANFPVGELNIEDFNVPQSGANSLGSIMFERNSEMYYNGETKNRFWTPVSPECLSYASKIMPGPEIPVVWFQLNASSSDIYVENPSYRDFLYKKFRVSSVDTSSFAIALAALSNDLPYIVFHGISNMADEYPHREASFNANVNAVKVLLRFIWLTQEH